MTIDHQVNTQRLKLLVCPKSHAPLHYDHIHQELISRRAHLAYPIRDGLPIMLPSQARHLPTHHSNQT